MYYLIAFQEGQKKSGAWGIILLLIGAWLIFDTWTPLPVLARGVIAFVGVALPFFIGQRLHKNPKTAEKVK
jgi:di/tricarboxylate transporter